MWGQSPFQTYPDVQKNCRNQDRSMFHFFSTPLSYSLINVNPKKKHHERHLSTIKQKTHHEKHHETPAELFGLLPLINDTK